ncbi:MAG: hypothetical protein ACI88H_003669 [Cocleimonas sp.]|jgi:hypothetical protein
MIEDKDKIRFLLVGAQKGGTSALDMYLRSNSNIQMAKRKEVHFFDQEGYFEDEINYEWYHQNFESNLGKLRGEATPIYMYWRDSIRRIYEYNPSMKIIAILRNPTERAFSHWNMERDREADNVPFGLAIRTENERCREALPLQHRVYSYIDRGYYSEQIRNIWRFFPKGQTLFLKQEDLKTDLHATLNKIASFLEVDEFEELDSLNVHSREYISKLTKEDKAFLDNIFLNDIKELELLLNWDCSNWMNN